MSRKNVLRPFKMFDAASLATSLTSNLTFVINQDVAHILISWTGTAPVGTITVQARHTKPEVNPQPAWFNLEGLDAIPVAGASGSHEILLTQMPFTEIQLLYTRTSGTGSLDAVIEAKVVGA